MTKDRLCELTEHLGSSKSWLLVLSILLRGLSDGSLGGVYEDSDQEPASY